jgi:hypothetical protein
MQTISIFQEVDEIKKYSQLSETELISTALIKGLKQIYYEELTKLYLNDSILEKDYISKVGYDYYEKIKDQKDVIDADFNWGTN